MKSTVRIFRGNFQKNKILEREREECDENLNKTSLASSRSIRTIPRACSIARKKLNILANSFSSFQPSTKSRLLLFTSEKLPSRFHFPFNFLRSLSSLGSQTAGERFLTRTSLAAFYIFAFHACILSSVPFCHFGNFEKRNYVYGN